MAVPTNDGTLNIKTGSLAVTSMRFTELALVAWLNSVFQVREGYSVPVVLGAPMDAFSHFQQLWADDNNPFRYLTEIKDDLGAPLYEPHPSPARYPIISVYRRGFKYRPGQNYSIHRFRHINWPTVSDDVARSDLGNVTTGRRPMAFDFRYQVDHFCMRPDTQALFVQSLMDQMWRTGGSLQTWIGVNYPVWGRQLVRLYIEGDIENTTPEEPEDGKNVEFRTTFSLVLEGYSVDVNLKVYPAAWEFIFRDSGIPHPRQLDEAQIVYTRDERADEENPTLDTRSNVPD